MSDLSPANDITFFAETNFRGERKRFGIKGCDRSKHMYIIGKTGMGKSTVLENMTIQDIRAGHGIAVVDPHGEYAEKVLDFIPRHRINDVIYFNPADTDYPVAFNIMEKVSEDQRHLVSSGLLGVFKKIWPDVWSPRMEYLLANAILALLEIPGATLLGVNRMFGEKDFRKKIVSQLNDPVIKSFWENEFAKYPEQFMREAVAAIQNKVGQFSSNPLIRNIIGQVESPLDMRALMDEGKILIVNLAKGRIGEENSRLLGALIITKLYLTAMSRVDMPEDQRRDFYLYVDEFQNFATESFANILSEARKYHLNLVVAHQYIMQMEEMVQHAIFGNVGTMVVFRVGAEDGEVLEKEFMPEFIVQDLCNLGFKNIYVKLMIDGITSRPFSAETLAPFPRPEETFRDTIIRISRERFGTKRDVVEDKIRRFIQSAATLESEGTPSSFHAKSEISAPSGAKDDRKMYETKCAACGKSVLVPFKPDGQRPVYCQDHMELIKLRGRTGGDSPPAGHRVKTASPMPAGARAENAEPVRPKIPSPVSLNTLKRFSGSENRRAAGNHDSISKGSHLAELRKALEDSLSERAANPKLTHHPQPLAPLQPEPAAKAGAPATKAGILQPGETIKFD